ncbi:MAG: TIGR02147 family protein [Bdellovibrionota bacterium]
MSVEKRKSKNSKPKQATDSLSVAILKGVLLKRQSKNSSYSLRAFAKSLGISHTALSLIFNGKRTINFNLISKIANKLDLNFRQRKLFLAEYNHGLTGTNNQNLEESFNLIDEDKFNVIAEWQHYAILSLIETKDFSMDYDWISKRLGISVLLVKTSIERLFRLKLIEKNAKGKWQQAGGYIRVNNNQSTAARKSFHQQLIKKAYRSLNNDPFEIRNHSAITFAMNPKDIPYAMERLKEFRIQLSEELENMNPKEEVYNLCLQLYPVSRRQS